MDKTCWNCRHYLRGSKICKHPNEGKFPSESSNTCPGFESRPDKKKICRQCGSLDDDGCFTNLCVGCPNYEKPIQSIESEPNKFVKKAEEIGALIAEKNKAYGNSFAVSGDVLRLLYPDGIPPGQFQDALSLVRIWDKMKRIATDKDAFGEDPFMDIAGYAILACVNREENSK
jgi:hypothetical protein